MTDPHPSAAHHFRRALLVLALLTGLTGQQSAAQVPSPSDSALSVEARTYVESALDTMQAHSMYRDSVDWAALRRAVFKRAAGAETPSDTYAALRYGLDRLDDHSGLMGAERAKRWAEGQGGEESGPVDPGPSPQGRLVNETIGYVRVPMIMTGEQAVKTARADSLQAIIARLDRRHGPCGWIVDLRGNRGGNMWPMLAGLGPLLGEGTFGAFGQSGTPWIYRDGRAMAGDAPSEAAQAAVSGDPYRLRDPDSPVAVLVGDSTASSGEAVLIAFQGRPNTRTFGTPTRGLTTSNAMYELRDGARMFLAAGAMADRTGTRYRGPIAPDVRVEESDSGAASSEDPVVQAATAWLNGRPSCGRSSRD